MSASKKKEFFVETPVGKLHVYESVDPEYPGVYVDLKRDGCNVEAPLLLLDFSHTEYPECLDGKTAEKGVLTCKIWNDVTKEDYETKAGFRNIDDFFAQEDTFVAKNVLVKILSEEIDRMENAGFGGGFCKYSVTNIGYKDIYGHEQETQVYAGKLDTKEGKQELVDLFESLCPEFKTTCDLVTYVDILATADTMEELEEMGY